MNAPGNTALMKVSIPALAMDEAELIGVLKSSLYPGAEDASIKLVIGYCRAAQLDPLQKPVHIVPMDVKVQKNPDKYEKRDVIMPGIGLYRVQAARTGEYAGMDDPVFGEMVELDFEDKDKKPAKIKYPHSCSVTVYRMKNGVKVGFTATEYWLENYATAGNWTDAPNKMWKKRPMGQLAKCSEAQALRKAFPEIGAQPTAEEMEGKTIDITPGVAALPPVDMPQSKSAPAAASAAQEKPVGSSSAAGETRDKKPEKPMSPSQSSLLKAKLRNAGLTEIDLDAAFPGKCIDLEKAKAGQTLFLMSEVNGVIEWIGKNSKA